MRWVAPNEPARDYSLIDRKLGLPSDQQIIAIARRMDSLHATHRDNRAATDPRHPRIIGLLGERHLARALGLRMDLAPRPYGSRRANFRLLDGTPVDVVTRTPPRNGAKPDLILKVNSKPLGGDRAMVLVCWLGNSTEPVILGYAMESEVRKQPQMEFRPGHPNWVMHADDLHPFSDLLERNTPKPTTQPALFDLSSSRLRPAF